MSNVIEEPARAVPVVWEGDVCVVGGSCTGVFAAVAAARRGARVCVVENQGAFGGTATLGLDCVWHPQHDTSTEIRLAAGLARELLDRLDRRDALEDRGFVSARHLQFIFNPFEMMIDLDEMVRDAGVRPFLHTRFVGAVREGNRVSAIIIEDQTGRRAIRARFFVDASGDALLVHRAGFPTYRQEHLQPPTTCAFIKGVGDLYRERPEFRMDWVFDRRYPEALPPGFCWGAGMQGWGDVQLVAGTRVHGADCSVADELTAAEIEGRRQVRGICDVMRRVSEDRRRIALVGLSSHIGIRQTRQARCRHTLTETEVLHGVRFEDAVVNGSYRVDVHFHDRAGLLFRYLDGVEEILLPGEPIQERRWRDPQPVDPTFWQIPYRSLVPVEAENIVVAGRCLDADEGAFGAVRVMINTTQMGEAAGVAAWLALDSNRSAADVDTAVLRRELARGGAVIL